MTDLTPDGRILERLERCYDGIPRVSGARTEAVGPFELFLRAGAGWPYYARPRLAEKTFTVVDVERVLARQKELDAPEAIEWVLDVTPKLAAAVEASGLPVTYAPLMVLDPTAIPRLIDESVALLDPASKDFDASYAVSQAVAELGFTAGGTAPGPDGPTERDAAIRPVDPARLAFIADGLRAGHKAEAVLAVPGEGIVARGALQSALGAAEVVGVATLPSARRRGYGATVSAFLARVAMERGNDLVFLSAASEDVARVYERIGFRRVGTAAIAER